MLLSGKFWPSMDLLNESVLLWVQDLTIACGNGIASVMMVVAVCLSIVERAVNRVCVVVCMKHGNLFGPVIFEQTLIASLCIDDHALSSRMYPSLCHRFLHLSLSLTIFLSSPSGAEVRTFSQGCWLPLFLQLVVQWNLNIECQSWTLEPLDYC